MKKLGAFHLNKIELNMFIFCFMFFSFCFSSLTHASGLLFQNEHSKAYTKRTTEDTLSKMKGAEEEDTFPNFLKKRGWSKKKEIPTLEEVNGLRENKEELDKLRAQLQGLGWSEAEENPGEFLLPSKGVVDQTTDELQEKLALLSELQKEFTSLGWLEEDAPVSTLKDEGHGVPAKRQFDDLEAVSEAIKTIVTEADFSKNEQHFLGRTQRKIALGGLFKMPFPEEGDLREATGLSVEKFGRFKRKFRIDYAPKAEKEEDEEGLSDEEGSDEES